MARANAERTSHPPQTGSHEPPQTATTSAPRAALRGLSFEQQEAALAPGAQADGNTAQHNPDAPAPSLWERIKSAFSGHPTREQFLAQALYGPEDVQAPTGLGGFSAQYRPATGVLGIGIRGHATFVDGLTLAASGSAVANHPQLEGAAQDINAMQGALVELRANLAAVEANAGLKASDKATQVAELQKQISELTSRRGGLVAEFQWSRDPAVKAAWLAQMQANVTTTWSGQHTFHVDQEGWRDITAVPRVNVAIAEGKKAGTDHVHTTIYRTPDKGRYDVGAYVRTKGSQATGHEMVLSHRDNRSANQRVAAGDGGILQRSLGSFALKSAVVTPAMDGAAQKLAADFLVHDAKQATPITLTVGAFASEASDSVKVRALALERGKNVKELLVAKGIAAERVQVKVEVAVGTGTRLRVGDGRPQDVAAHEIGHMLGLSDHYDDAGNGRGGTLKGTGKPTGTAAKHDELAKEIGVKGGAVHENNDGIMSVGTNVKPSNYATLGWSLKKITKVPAWKIQG